MWLLRPVMIPSRLWAFVVIILRLHNFLTLHDTVSKCNPEITILATSQECQQSSFSGCTLIPFCDLMDLDSNRVVLLTWALYGARKLAGALMLLYLGRDGA